MSLTGPDLFADVVEAAARHYDRSLNVLGCLNGEEAPPPERNAVFHLGTSFHDAGFAVYTEAWIADARERADLVASDGAHTFVVETKSFGNINWAGVLTDAQRVERYVPQAAGRLGGVNPLDFWTSSRRWACLLIQSFRRATDSWHSLMDGRPEPGDGFEDLAAFLLERDAKVGMSHVCSERWPDSSPLFLLWAAFANKGAS